MAPLVSILIPAYNADRWIAETIRSALNQTWGSKEIIIVDDGSSDNTLQIAKNFESKELKVFSQKNKGASSARNKAFSYAQGDYIQWLDADDLLAPDKISQQLVQSDYGADHSLLLSSCWGRFYFRYNNAKFMTNALWQDLTPIDWLLIRFRERLNVWMQPASFLVSRKLTEDAGKWDERLSLDDDGEYFCRVVSKSKKIKFISESKSYYRIGNPNSLGRRLSDKALDSLFLSICLCINHLRKLEDTERTRKASLKFLQNRIGYFHPNKNEIINEANELAKSLGGSIKLPKESLKFSIIRKIFGLRFALELKDILWKSDILIRKNWDKLLYTLYSTMDFGKKNSRRL